VFSPGRFLRFEFTVVALSVLAFRCEGALPPMRFRSRLRALNATTENARTVSSKREKPL
jgi:hypothetical protein